MHYTPENISKLEELVFKLLQPGDDDKSIEEYNTIVDTLIDELGETYAFWTVKYLSENRGWTIKEILTEGRWIEIFEGTPEEFAKEWVNNTGEFMFREDSFLSGYVSVDFVAMGRDMVINRRLIELDDDLWITNGDNFL